MKKIFLFVVVIIGFLPSLSFADDICKYAVSYGNGIRASDDYPLMFHNVRNIQLTTESSRDLMDDPFLSAEPLGKLAKCTLAKHLKDAPIPTEAYISKGANQWSDDINQKVGKGILNILIRTSLRKSGSNKGYLKQDIIILTVSYARATLKGFKTLKFQCSEIFPRVESKEIEQQLLAEATRSCLDGRFTFTSDEFDPEAPRF